MVEFHAERGDHIITAATEHKAVLDSCKALEKAGRATVTVLPVGPRRTGRSGRRAPRHHAAHGADLDHARQQRDRHAPPDRGEIGRIAKDAGVLFHCDAAQSVGKVPLDVEAMGIDLLAFTAHKLYGPKGCGALYVRGKAAARAPARAQMHGGGHERGMRSGTLNVPGVVGLGQRLRAGGEPRWRPSRRASARCASGCTRGLATPARGRDAERPSDASGWPATST